MGLFLLISRRFTGFPFGEYSIVDGMPAGASLKHIEEKFDAGQRHFGSWLVYGVSGSNFGKSVCGEGIKFETNK